MYKKPLLLEVAGLAIVIALLHYLALTFSLYWTVWWFDIVMHFLGGFFVAAFSLYLVFVMRLIKMPVEDRVMFAFVAIGAVVVIGLGWELWELLTGLTLVLRDTADTLLDLLMDIIGGSFGLWYGTHKLCKRN